jgi:hypothetical protein
VSIIINNKTSINQPQQKYKQSRNRHLYNKSINIIHKAEEVIHNNGSSVEGTSTNLVIQQFQPINSYEQQFSSKPNIPNHKSNKYSSYKKSLVQSTDFIKPTPLVQSAKPALDTKAQPIIVHSSHQKPETARKHTDSSQKRQLPIF